MNEVSGKEKTQDKWDVDNLLQDGVVELTGGKGKPVRFGFMAALEHEGDLFIVLTKLGRKQQINHELLLLRLIRAENGAFEDYEVVHDPLQATALIDRYIHIAVQALFEGDLFADGALSMAEDAMDEDDEEETSILH